ncbi:hypothetical protein Dimus_014311 [Dionaea muscipula]
MSKPNFPAPPPPPPLQRPAPLRKQRTWSPDIHRDEAWLRRKDQRNRRRKSLTDEDLDELKACIELGFGFGFDSPDPDKRLSDTFPALGFYYAVNRHYSDTVSKSSSSPESDMSSPAAASPHAMFSPGDDPETVKTRLRRWAQVVACSVRLSSCSDNGR